MTIVRLYDALLTAQPTPVIALNRAIAIGFRDGPEAGLEALAPLAETPQLASYHLMDAAQADFLRQAGRTDDASSAYRRAYELATDDANRGFLSRRLDGLDGPPGHIEQQQEVKVSDEPIVGGESDHSWAVRHGPARIKPPQPASSPETPSSEGSGDRHLQEPHPHWSGRCGAELAPSGGP